MRTMNTIDAGGRARERRLLRGVFAWALGAVLAVVGAGVGIVPAQASDPQVAKITTLTGKIVNSAGQPISGAKLTASPNMGDTFSPPPRTATTRADGTFTLVSDLSTRFVLGVEGPAPYVGSVLDTSGKLAAGDSSRMRIFDGGGTFALGTLTLQSGVKVSGNFVLSGFPVKTSAWAALTGEGANAGKYFGGIRAQAANGATAWSAYVLPGEYSLEGSAGSVSGAFASGAAFTVPAGGRSGLDLVFTGSGIGVSGIVVDPDGKPAAGVLVSLEDTTGANLGRYTATTDWFGRWVVPTAPAAHYRVTYQNGRGDFGYWKSGSAAVVPDPANATALNATTAGMKSVLGVAMRRGGPSEPLSVTATAGDGRAVVAWQAPADRNDAIIYQYSVTAYDGEAPVWSVTTTGARSVVVPKLKNGTAYTFKVQAFTGYGASLLSAPSAAVTPKAPTG